MAEFDMFGDVPASAPNSDPAAEFLANQQQQLAGLMDDDFGGAFGSSSITDSTPQQQQQQHQQHPFGGEQSADSGDFFSQNEYEQPNHGESPNHQEDANAGAKVDVYTAMRLEMDESDKLRQWRAAQRERLAKKDSDEEARRKECYAAAKRELDDWYKHYGDQVNKTRSANRDMEKMLIAERVEPLAVGTESQAVIWDRVTRLCDFNPKNVKFQKDITHFRSLLLQLKQTPPIRN